MVATLKKPAEAPLTAAETALVAQFGHRSSHLPGNADTVMARDQAVQAIKAHRLPTRKVEAWHYTDLRRLLNAMPEWRSDVAAGPADPLVDNAHRFVLINGQLIERTEIEGCQIEAVADALRADVGGVILEAPTEADDAIGAINTAFVTDGVRLTVAEGADIERPIELQSIHDGGQVHTRNLVTVGAGAKAAFIDRHMGSDEDVLASNATELTVREGAEVRWIIVQEQGAAASHLGTFRLTLEKDAKATLFIANYGGRLVRQEVHAAATGEGAELAFRAINMIGEKTHCDVTLELDHLVANTTSTETVRNVVTGKAQGVFQGQIRVARAAQKTDAQMACNTLLLSDESGFATKPELEIFADDVVCAHGATVAEIDEDHLFYLMARGISAKTARGLLIEAFVDEIVEELDDDALIEALEIRIADWLEANG
ncbi:Fe-S cluster assembly protein SufD [Oceaniradius stylonematis]|uniref:Fe-S cluster assembly protein SufD n=1 Tax=Oceaniradius stylonematis TaxID=2184161 RepID=UPI000F3AE76D|nr:Fe-S cluster assembly protein SufD [Oceaniradius stylonematis]RNC95101.1 MAG: Fe-S cluster assembly protein SufD [Oricola sp.]